ncbi:hypothetical protein ACP275_01G100400 [Erythranthe tilingii]
MVNLGSSVTERANRRLKRDRPMKNYNESSTGESDDLCMEESERDGKKKSLGKRGRKMKSVKEEEKEINGGDHVGEGKERNNSVEEISVSGLVVKEEKENTVCETENKISSGNESKENAVSSSVDTKKAESGDSEGQQEEESMSCKMENNESVDNGVVSSAHNNEGDKEEEVVKVESKGCGSTTKESGINATKKQMEIDQEDSLRKGNRTRARKNDGFIIEGSEVEEKISQEEEENTNRRKRSDNRRRSNPIGARKVNSENVPKRVTSKDQDGFLQSNMCHQCQRNDKGKVERCVKCKTKRYCVPCMTTWYPKMSEEDFATVCPVCRNNCNCKACLRMELPIKGLLEIQEKSYPGIDKDKEVPYSKYIIVRIYFVQI